MPAQSRPGCATFRLRIRNLDSSYADHAPRSAQQRQTLIHDVLNINTSNVEAGPTGRARGGNKNWLVWAILNVRSFSIGEDLVRKIGQIVQRKNTI